MLAIAAAVAAAASVAAHVADKPTKAALLGIAAAAFALGHFARSRARSSK